MVSVLERSRGGELAAVTSRDADRAAAFAAAHGAERSYGGPDAVTQLLADGVDVVHVANTHPQHHARARAAPTAGTPVLVEQPMTVSLAATRDLAEMSPASSRFLVEAYWTRLLPGTAALLEVLAPPRPGTRFLGDQVSTEPAVVSNAAPRRGTAP